MSVEGQAARLSGSRRAAFGIGTSIPSRSMVSWLKASMIGTGDPAGNSMATIMLDWSVNPRAGLLPGEPRGRGMDSA